MQRQKILALILTVTLLVDNAHGVPECLQSRIGVDYSGHVNSTRTGRTCQAWNVDESHSHRCSYREDHNYCRNPEEGSCRGSTPWCYTTDPNTSWDYCNIPMCEPVTETVLECRKSPEGYAYRGHVNTTKSGRTCQDWNVEKPHITTGECAIGLVGNYCRNKDHPYCAEPTPWCYTTDSDKSWELCDIPMCDPIAVIARGYREFGDCIVFFDHNRNTCEDVTSTTNALDFILRAGPLQSQNTYRINVTMQKGNCNDDKQLHVYTVTKLSGGPFDGSFRRCQLTTTEPLGGATVCSFTCQCTDQPCLYVTARIFGNFGPVKSLCEIEID